MFPVRTFILFMPGRPCFPSNPAPWSKTPSCQPRPAPISGPLNPDLGPLSPAQLRNLPLGLDEKGLRALAVGAVKERATKERPTIKHVSRGAALRGWGAVRACG